MERNLVQDIASIFWNENSFDISVFGENSKNYELRDNIERAISKVLPLKHIIDIQNSDITVELFHGNITDSELNKMKEVLNKTFETCKKYDFTSCPGGTNIRTFLFDNKDQYSSSIKEIYDSNDVYHNGITKNNEASDDLFLADANIYLYRNFYDNSNVQEGQDFCTAEELCRDLYSNDNSLGEDEYFVLAKEFFHVLHSNRLCNYQINTSTCSAMKEGLASFFAWQLLKGLGYHDQELHSVVGAKIIKDNQLSLSDAFFNNRLLFDDQNAKDVETAIECFMMEKHPELLISMIDYYYLQWCNNSLLSTVNTTDMLEELYNQVEKVSKSVEFPYWVANHYEKHSIKNNDAFGDLQNDIEILKDHIENLENYLETITNDLDTKTIKRNIEIQGINLDSYARDVLPDWITYQYVVS